MNGSSVCHSGEQYMQASQHWQLHCDFGGLKLNGPVVKEWHTADQGKALAQPTACHRRTAAHDKIQPRQPLPKRHKPGTEEYKNDIGIKNEYTSLLSLVHAVYQPVVCTVCDHKSLTPADATAHFRTNHPSEARYSCLHPHCKRRFKTLGALHFHMSHSHLIRHITKRASDTPLSRSRNSTDSHALSLTAAANRGVDLPLLDQKPSFAGWTRPKASLRSESPGQSLSPSPPASSIPVEKPPNTNRKALSLQTATGILSPPTPSPASASPATNSSTFASSFKIPLSSRRAPRGSKKIVLSAETEALLNSVYHPLQCPSCHKMFNRKTNVIKHLTDSHYGEEPYRCVFPLCVHPKLYATREGLVYHLVRSHDGEAK